MTGLHFKNCSSQFCSSHVLGMDRMAFVSWALLLTEGPFLLLSCRMAGTSLLQVMAMLRIDKVF